VQDAGGAAAPPRYDIQAGGQAEVFSRWGMHSNTATTYDLIPYPNYSFPQSHPDRLAVIAVLFGLNPPPVERCRVLELGCASGANLIPMADELPQSKFVGIDLSRRQIDEGHKAIAELGLGNIELRQQSILEFEPGPQPYDYILCHGVYSWVPPHVQDRILAICRQALRPEGIAFVSYNTLPGWHMHGVIRDMMLYHGRRFSDPRQQVAQARGLLDFLVASVPMEANPYGQFLRAELETLRQMPDAYLFHDHLEEDNNPLYFHQFVERAASHGLRYLAEAEFHTMYAGNFAEPIRQALERASKDFIQLEQYMDFLRNRAFRQSLLCPAGQTPRYQVQSQTVDRLFIASALRPDSASPDLTDSVREDFRVPSGSTAFSTSPIVKAALLVLGEAWPASLPCPELFSRAQAKIGVQGPRDALAVRSDEERLRHGLLRFSTITSDLVEFRLRGLPVVAAAGRLPLARPLARWQARTGRPVTNCRHELLTLDEFQRQALQRLDGQHTRATLAQDLAVLVQSGQLALPPQGQLPTEPMNMEQATAQTLERHLEQFARLSLLLA
jgi:methyltransferase-like protein/SAM-dependent methyltransferase